VRRILLSAYQCAPGAGSVSQIGWEWYSRLSRHVKVTLATHIRNKELLEKSGSPLNGSEIIYIDTEWLARPLWKTANALFPGSEHSAFLFSSFDYFAYEHELLKAARKRQVKGQCWDVVHVVTPVSPSAVTRMASLQLPLIRGPLNGGLETPKQFPELMKADSAWVYPLREITRPMRLLMGEKKSGDIVLAANQVTRRSLTNAEQRVARSMMEIAVDIQKYEATPWPDAPSAENPLRIVFVGRLIPAKALSLLLDAMQEMKDSFPIDLTVVGDGPMRAEWEAKAESLGKRVRFLGALGAKEVVQEIQKAHVLCLPSVRESGGAVLLEAMSCARPVIAVAHGGPADIVHDAVGKLVPADNARVVIEGLKAAMTEIFHEPGKWSERGQQGRKEAEERHSWDAHVMQMLGMYDELTTLYNLGAAS